MDCSQADLALAEQYLAHAQTGDASGVASFRNISPAVRHFALRLAAANGHSTCVQLLVRQNCRENCIDALFVAAAFDEVGSVLALLDAHVQVDGVLRHHGPTALQVAACHGCADTVTALVRRGADMYASSSALPSALPSDIGICVGRRIAVWFAAHQGHDAVVATLVAEWAAAHPLFRPLARWYLPLGLAVEHCATTTVALLLDAKADTVYGGPYLHDVSPLRLALEGGCADKVRLLLDAKAHTDYVGPYLNDVSPLRLALEGGRADMVRLLLNARADVCNGDTCFTGSVVGDAIDHGTSDDVIAALLAAKAPASGRLGPDGSALLLATRASRAAVVRQLLDCKALGDLDVADYEGTTPLVASAATKSPAITAALLGAKANVNFCHEDSWPPLHAFSVRSPPAELAKLLTAKARVDATDACGRTALHVAVDNGNMDAVQLLLDAGGKADLRDRQGLTPEDYAVFRERADIAEVLRGVTPE